MNLVRKKYILILILTPVLSATRSSFSVGNNGSTGKLNPIPSVISLNAINPNRPQDRSPTTRPFMGMNNKLQQNHYMTPRETLAQKKEAFKQAFKDAYEDPVSAAVVYAGGLVLQNLVTLVSTIKDWVICYDYTPEQAEPEIAAIISADMLGERDSKNIAMTQHFINICKSLFGYRKIVGGDPKLEKHALALESIDPKYASFLLRLNGYHKYGDLAAIASGKHTETEEWNPPYEILQYLKSHPDKARIEKSIKKLVAKNTKPNKKNQQKLLPVTA